MGCTESQVAPHDGGKVGSPNQKQTSKTIEERLLSEMNDEKKVMKCLLLGAGECGKSTILKQMKILHLNGFSEEEKKNYRPLCWKNTLESIQSLIQACETLQIAFEKKDSLELAQKIMSAPLNNVPLTLKPDIKALWKDAGIRRARERSNEFHLLDSADYFLDEIDRVFSDSYQPTTQDILRSRVATTGVIETEFSLDSMQFKMYDVGGQRGERKKWIHCFDSVTAIMFIGSLSEYDQVLAEDRTKNRLKESLDLFEGIINLPWFREVPTILFLNKDDLFRKKVEKVDLGIYFPTYSGGLSYGPAKDFITKEFLDRNENQDKKIYCHVTDATNTENISFVWKATRHVILERSLTRSGLRVC